MASRELGQGEIINSPGPPVRRQAKKLQDQVGHWRAVWAEERIVTKIKYLQYMQKT